MKAKITFELINKIGKLQTEVRKAREAAQGTRSASTTGAVRARKKSDDELSTLVAADKEFEIRDDELAGLVLRVRPTGKMMYTLVYARGKRIQIGSADAVDHIQARSKAKKILADLCLTGKDPIEQRNRPQANTYLQFLDGTYKPWLAQNIKQPKMAYDTLRNAFPELHDLPLNDVTRGLIEQWRVRRGEEGIKPATINRQLNDLRACLQRAVDIWELIEANPLDKIKLGKTDKHPKVRYLSPDEESSLRKALDDREDEMKTGRQSANEWRAERGYSLYGDLQDQAFADHLKPAVLLSINTGLRRGELLQLKWENVDFDLGNLTVEADTAKSGKTRHISLSDEALAVLKTWKEQPGIKSRYVFTDSSGQPFHDVRTSWGGVLKRAKITDFRWHDLRHTFASKLVMAGVDLYTVKELLGHSTYAMTERYAHLSQKHKEDAVKKLVPIREAAAQ